MKHLYSLLVGLAMTGTIMAQTVLVTLSVDMSNQDVAAEGVHVAGDFQGWDPAGTTALTDDDMDGIYEVTLELSDSLSSIQYKFLNGNAWGSGRVRPGGLRHPGTHGPLCRH